MSVTDMSTRQRVSFRCRARTFAAAMKMAEKEHPGFFAALRSAFKEGHNHAPIDT
ncbi:hypothetical protein [Azotobacter salinestris]|uniref:hypothetical protein n=1 Tax=Azotobacter salinestris TaxID=69964 RepID=UPI0032DFB400